MLGAVGGGRRGEGALSEVPGTSGSSLVSTTAALREPM